MGGSTAVECGGGTPENHENGILEALILRQCTVEEVKYVPVLTMRNRLLT